MLNKEDYGGVPAEICYYPAEITIFNRLTFFYDNHPECSTGGDLAGARTTYIYFEQPILLSSILDHRLLSGMRCISCGYKVELTTVRFFKTASTASGYVLQSVSCSNLASVCAASSNPFVFSALSAAFNQELTRAWLRLFVTICNLLLLRPSSRALSFLALLSPHLS
jgi:hypothetical protein